MNKNYTFLLPISALIIALSIAYYLVIYIPKKENQKIEQQRVETQEQKVEKQKNQANLTVCLIDADNAYTTNWNNECKSQGLLSSVCINLLDMTLDEYAKENNVENISDAAEEFYNKQSDCSCRLPFANSDRIDKLRKDAKNECYKSYQ